MSRIERLIRPASSVFCATVGDEAVLYDDQSGQYFGLNPVATRVWQLAGQGTPVASIQAVLQQEFDVESSRLDKDLERLLEQMASQGLWVIETLPESGRS